MPAPVPNGPGTCPACLRPVLWTTTAARGVPMAVGRDPHPTGNAAVYCDGVGRWRSRQLTTERPVAEHAEQLHRPHVADCPGRSRRTARARPGRRAAYGPGAVVLPFRRR